MLLARRDFLKSASDNMAGMNRADPKHLGRDPHRRKCSRALEAQTAKRMMTRLPPIVEAGVRDFQARLIRLFGPRLADLRLFGSYARGDFGPESDVDILVVVRELVGRERREIFDLAEEVFFDRLVHCRPWRFRKASGSA